MRNPPLLAYYGDDFTGSTDVLEALTVGGVQTVLFLGDPSAERLADFPDAQAVGIAGTSRALPTQAMREVLRRNLTTLRGLKPGLVHLKICSTFDSSPSVGSIGAACEVGRELFGGKPIPMVVGAVALKRFVCFGNLFAAFGDETVRLDRHPTMSRHPVTPMDEADLRRHLARQTDLKVGSIDLAAMNRGDIEPALQRALNAKSAILLFDTASDTHLEQIGRLMWSRREQMPFVVGSSGVEYALRTAWRAKFVSKGAEWSERSERVEPLLVMSGSCSPQTASQIERALTEGFVDVRIDPFSLDEEQLTDRIVRELEVGSSVVAHSAMGPDDPRVGKGAPADLAERQGRVVRSVLERVELARICVAGGDTCGMVAKRLGIDALTMISPMAPGGPLCRAHSTDPRFDGLQVCLKGGQVGQDDFFVRVREGGS